MKKENRYLLILCGEAFSGKSMLAEKIAEIYKAKIVGRDKIYFAVDNILALENTSDEDDDRLWKNLWPIAVQGIKNQLLLGNSVVVDDNCLYLQQREELYSLAKNLDIKHVLVYLNIAAEILKERKEQNKINKNRHDVPSGWLEKDSKFFERPNKIENPLIFTEKNTPDEILKKIESIIV